jgi:hypothetical protein
VPVETQPGQPATSTPPAEPVSPGPAPAAPAAADTGDTGADHDPGAGPVPVRRTGQRREPGGATRRFIVFGGVALLVGAAGVGFTGWGKPRPAAAELTPLGAVRPRGRARGGLERWDDGIPLAPGKRELARRRAGLSRSRYLDDLPGGVNAWRHPDDEPGA